jgi:hypothetical protein
MENNVWMPQKEYLLMKEMMDAMSPIQRMRQAYFFWNNFSEEGFDEHLASLVLKNQEKNKENDGK